MIVLHFVELFLLSKQVALDLLSVWGGGFIPKRLPLKHKTSNCNGVPYRAYFMNLKV